MEQSDVFIVSCGVVGLGFAGWNLWALSPKALSVTADKSREETATLNAPAVSTAKVEEIQSKIALGARSFLRAEYGVCCGFLVAFGVVLFALSAAAVGFKEAALTTVSFALGGTTSMASGFVGMTVAVYANGKTTLAAASEPPRKLRAAFKVAFRAGAGMGFALCGLGVVVLATLLVVYRSAFFPDDLRALANCVAGFGLGGSSVAMFGRVGGGIYTKAADVGADLVGKVIHGLEEDDPKNPATIADNVGDNVGDVAGMGADLFGSFAEATCAALVLGAQAGVPDWGAFTFPVALSAAGIPVCLACSFLATHLRPPAEMGVDVENALKTQLVATTALALPVIAALAYTLLPEEPFGDPGITRGAATTCACAGALAGLLVGLVTEYYTSHSFEPVRECARACKRGAAVNVIFGLALGYKSAVVPAFALAAVVYASFALAGLYGVALAALGMLTTLATGLTIDGYGPVTDNAGGIAEMAQLPEHVRDKTDCLDAAGNTTAAIGKGYCIGSAALVALALYGAFVARLAHYDEDAAGITVDALDPLTFAFLIVGANLPYWFSALTMKSVGVAAADMVREVQRQFRDTPALLDPASDAQPDYDRCVSISTRASLREMVAPAALVMAAPLLAGTFFGVTAVFGLLTGGLVSAVQLAVSMSNSGGAWDNAKKYIAVRLSLPPSGTRASGRSRAHCRRRSLAASSSVAPTPLIASRAGRQRPRRRTAQEGRARPQYACPRRRRHR